MRGGLISYLVHLSLANRQLLKQVFLSLTEFPILSEAYHHVYYRCIRDKVVQGLSELDIETYNVCNLRCTMCPYVDMTREKVLMSMDLFKKIIDDATANSIREVCLNFYNEPLLDPLLFERIKYTKSRGLKVVFNSNGCLLTEEKINSLLDSNLDSIIFSFDGATKETYEKVRVGANFDKTRSNITQLIQERDKRGMDTPFVEVYFVAQKDNYQEIAKFKSLWKGLANKVSIGVVDARRTDKLLPEGLRPRKSKYIYPCRAIFQHMVVMSNGKVALCCSDYDGQTILGDLNTQTIDEVWTSDKIKEIRELHLSGQGDKIELCRSTDCGQIYREGSYTWWR